MIKVLGCIAYEHNPWLVLVALLVAAAGAWVSAHLFQRARSATGSSRFGWHFLTGISAAVAIWCTHFIAMLGFDPGVPVLFDTWLTMSSLLIAMLGATAGLVVGACWRARFAPVTGGMIVGLVIALMHYTGMLAYRVDGLESWNVPYVAASVVLSVVLSALALHYGTRHGPHDPQGANLMAGILALAIAALHFTGMTALEVEPVSLDAAFVDPSTRNALAIAVAFAALVIVAVGIVTWLLDREQRTESIEQLRQMALNDPLTGLPNRVSFGERLELELAAADGEHSKLALVGIDLNRFKEINDLRGHQAGDEVLRILARRMRNLLGSGEFISRIGGDEFIAIKRFAERSVLVEFLTRLESALSRPIRYDDWDFVPGASLGVAIYPDDAKVPSVLVNNADLAMYRAKVDVTRTICFYEPAMDETVRARRHLAVDLREALVRNQLSLYYQVQTSIATGKPIGYEALLRWEHPRHGFISPAEFIPIAEESGLILQIGEWVLKEACLKATTWEPPYRVAVNLSAVQLAHADLPLLVGTILKETGLAPERLELELTESTIFANRARSLEILREIKAMGVGIALDDFGTGYSSLDTLRAFPFDKIKLDGSFVKEIDSDPQAIAIIRAVLALGKSLGVPVLAEGIETPDQLQIISGEGCNEIQGFLFGRPVPLNQLVSSGQIRLIGNTTNKSS
ncbi:EAL domain-containing protein [Paraburkholderia sp. Ac-20347]|uniref:putative bifunctional diguanylate cyclase/phosphodiesterase n=1 Tax=Paraburkholderia sp. Ac-20347 TaxID=2703892 RepID=UPI00197E2828|nr:EAL domain-containing protein [Paraburkholderia sp. Ac-20347]MBN3813623.1 EAL domain-containing protein [Paraburkholderia sp. Ac-20347]